MRLLPRTLTRRVAAVGLVVTVLVLLWRLGVIAAPAQPAVLVVGDSLVVAAAPALRDYAPPGVSVEVLAGIGASPCDVLAGYRQPDFLGGGSLSYRTAIDTVSPKAVVLSFTGNAGLSDHACVPDPSGRFSLPELLGAYRSALTTMGQLAQARGARIYLAAVPARNPATPEGWDGRTQHGYNGDPAFNTMLSGLARDHGWLFDEDPALLLADPEGGWSLYLPCLPSDGAACHDGRVQVRVGGPDAIHCDDPGTNGPGSASAGSARYARGLLQRPLAAMGHRLEAAGGHPPCTA